jgi:MoaA/NifB/PqqE/SkfB family radical SAM enzyme
MSFEEFRRVIDQFPKLKWMGLTGIGSSFINKDFLAMLRYAKKRSIFLEFFDTFDLIDARTADELITIGVDKIWVSMEAATKQTYESVRVGARFEKTLANVRYLLDAKKRMKSPLPELWFHYIMNSMNTAEMPQFVDLVKDIVGDNPTCYTTLIYFTSLLHFKEVETLIPVLTPEIQREVAQRARRYNIRLNWNENVESNKPICDCTKWVEPFVLATGHVQPCCAINMANDREFQKQHSWGNLFHEHFRDVWNSDKVRLFKKQIHAGERPVVCKNCRIYKV